MKYFANEDFNIKKIAESGQCFRFNEVAQNEFRLVAKERILTVKLLNDNLLDFSCDEEEFNALWKHYFDLETDYSKIRDKVIDDSFLLYCVDYGKGIRILNQDIFETVISFIISQRKSIPAIKTSVEKLCILAGNEIENGIYSFPTPECILRQKSEDLAACGLGYRLDYVLAASEYFYENKKIINELSLMSDEDLFNELKSIKGIGDKVASCISLFGFHRLNSFPKDVWINRALSDKYPNGFDFNLYKPYNGVIQQYIFYAYKGTK